MRFVEAIAGELGHLIEDLLGLARCDAARHRAFDEGFALGVHFRLDLFAHCAAEQIGAAQRVARQHLGDLHDLFLVDHDAVGFLQDLLKRWVQVVGLLLAVLYRNVARDVLHRPGTVQRDDGDNVFEAVGAQLLQHVAHAGAFDLEHPDRVTARQELVGGAVIEWQVGEIEIDAARRQ